jgi:hypothetical protein
MKICVITVRRPVVLQCSPQKKVGPTTSGIIVDDCRSSAPSFSPTATSNVAYSHVSFPLVIPIDGHLSFSHISSVQTSPSERSQDNVL